MLGVYIVQAGASAIIESNAQPNRKENSSFQKSDNSYQPNKQRKAQKKKKKKIMMPFKEEKEAKKEAFRKYLESSGVLDALTKVLVALYEQNDKPSSALEFIQQKLGGPSASDYEKLQAEMSDLQTKYNQLLAAHQEISKELEEVKSSHDMAPSSAKETSDGEPQKERL